VFSIIGNVLGWIALASLLTAYLLITFRELNLTSFFYQSLFFIDCFGFLVSAIATKNWLVALFNSLISVLSDYNDSIFIEIKINKQGAERPFLICQILKMSYDLGMETVEFNSLDNQKKKLIKAAEKTMKAAYAPYSNFSVGAAILTKKGKIITGSNVENASYGLTICAERTAIFKAISLGERSFKAIAIISSGNKIFGPCGACRQVFYEFFQVSGIDFLVIMTNLKKEKVILAKISELLPLGFGPESLQ